MSTEIAAHLCNQFAFLGRKEMLLTWASVEEAMDRNRETSSGTSAKHRLLLDVPTDTIPKQLHEQASRDAGKGED